MTAQESINPNFFPTSKREIAKMLAPYRSLLRPKNGARVQILDPSAGAGDILDYLKEGEFETGSSLYRSGIDKEALYAIELDPELVFTLQGKGYKVIHNDFLTYSGEYLFDLIIMNPPFDRGDEHLLKAWQIMHEGHIVCLLNEETIKNPHTARRKALKAIIEAHGSVEYLGACFTDAKRKTDVRVAMVRLEKNEPSERFNFDFRSDSKESRYEFTEDIAGDSVALNDLTGALLRSYEETKRAFVQYVRARNELASFGSPLVDSHTSVLKMADESMSFRSNKESYNGFIDKFKSAAWSQIISKLGMGKFLTNRVMQDFEKFKKHQGAMDLTRENILELVNMLIMNRGQIMDKAIEDVFNTFTEHHKENRQVQEGWKTNSGWKVNRKVILPWWVSYGEYSSAYDLKQYGSKFSVNYSYNSNYRDIDKVMCYLTGKDWNECYTLEDSLKKRFDILGHIRTGDDFLNEGESEFFTYKFFKKGTLHITFRDEKLWEEFNFRACLGKNWLPADEEKAYRQRKAKETKQDESEKQPETAPEPLLLSVGSIEPEIALVELKSEQIEVQIAEIEQKLPEVIREVIVGANNQLALF